MSGSPCSGSRVWLLFPFSFFLAALVGSTWRVFPPKRGKGDSSGQELVAKLETKANDILDQQQYAITREAASTMMQELPKRITSCQGSAPRDS